MHHRLLTSRDHRSDPRGLGGGLAAVIALTLALAAALQAGISRLATPDFAAAIAIALPAADQDTRLADVSLLRGPRAQRAGIAALGSTDVAHSSAGSSAGFDAVRESCLSRAVFALPPPAC